MKFSVGDLVLVPDRNTVTDLLADAIGDLQDGLITYAEMAEMERRLYGGLDMQIYAIEEDGYVLCIPGQKKGVTGIMWDDDLRSGSTT